MNNFIQRTLTGLLFVVVLIASITLSSISFFCLFLVILILSLKEFYDLSKKTGAQPHYLIGILAGAYIFIASYLTAKGLISPLVQLGIIPAFTLIFILELFRNKENPFNNIAYTILGLIYIALPISLFNFIIFPYSPKSDAFYPGLLLGLFILQWANDTG
ncbi:MAG: phosphatidate cytidylyltransferase, partial [Bacteroidota bacterium]|nr:phosphatidate cytidylyltransferase [Bacteroidota bacterium]